MGQIVIFLYLTILILSKYVKFVLNKPNRQRNEHAAFLHSI